jgi:hypothetical protein
MSKTKIVLSTLAIVVGTASGAMAATKHPVHHRVAVEQPVTGANAYGYSRTAPQTNEPSYMAIQSQDYRENN